MQLVFDHVLTAYGDNGESAYNLEDGAHSPKQSGIYSGLLDVDKIADDVVARIHDDPAFAAYDAAQLGVTD